MKAAGSAAEMEFFGDSDEITQMAKLDIHIQNILIDRNKILDI